MNPGQLPSRFANKRIKGSAAAWHSDYRGVVEGLHRRRRRETVSRRSFNAIIMSRRAAAKAASVESDDDDAAADANEEAVEVDSSDDDVVVAAAKPAAKKGSSGADHVEELLGQLQNTYESYTIAGSDKNTAKNMALLRMVQNCHWMN